MLGVGRTNDIELTSTLDDFAMDTDFLDGGAYFHRTRSQQAK